MTLPANKPEAIPSTAARPPAVWLVGPSEHADFREAVALIRAEAKLDATTEPPELIIIAQDRPGAVDQQAVEQFRRQAPLAGIVSLVGSWCEGEPRTGRPPVGVTRLYWYEFAPWWRRQMERRDEGLCPDWAIGNDCGMRISDCGIGREALTDSGLIALTVPRWETADALADILLRVGYATIWQPPANLDSLACAVTAGIWEGAQLDDGEAAELQRFCARLAGDGAPVVALLDFPRRESLDRARSVGAAAVLAKPWLNVDLVATLRHICHRGDAIKREAIAARAA
jgi:hypothetical protein